MYEKLASYWYFDIAYLHWWDIMNQMHLCQVRNGATCEQFGEAADIISNAALVKVIISAIFMQMLRCECRAW